MKITDNHILQFVHPKKSAWQAVYVYINDKKLAYFGITPEGSGGYGMMYPQVFGGVWNKDFRLNIPHLKWRNNASPLYYKMYQAQNKLLHKLDTRYT